LYAAFHEGDIHAIVTTLHPEVQWGEPDNPFNPCAGTRHGHSGFLEWVRIGRDAEDILVLDPRQFLAGDNTVAVVGYTKCLARSTGRTYETDFVHVMTFDRGRIVRFQEFFDTYVAGEAFKTA
jgi:ketosteroid isomerase-like protein